ncbi:UDP-N-acetylmuramoyl-tripeptide--D-alanyl-D-alanine ligase [Desulfovibrio ferrophilus]|uniref:UDP-N-acetylmuramoyl-tripeptide--D-alanyl-D-alanine ligase n=1 Tax=Desulfovibrio ferrophilus TaxID=241368 RepID=A0A2Z6AZA6_9BACT|nr:UDP-N-acetylmuramoyl-tripeptide--D-alanyl-D-alanine ligase [Desulfovibrio ferrophilus]BBD08548.1 UDP-N-acetylmuramoyl-tripeptide--D-alanyl-D-alanine ligase [Desulfovibrio ferrophilus]
MLNLTVTQAAIAMGALGDVENGQDIQLSGVCTDSRVLRPGEIFFCLSGENFDGHEFAGRAMDGGAAAVVVSRPLPELAGRAPVLMVRDVLQALGALGAAWRMAAQSTVVGVTGSAGKTTVKEMLAGMLEAVGETGKNYKNFNNQLGVPQCMMGLTGAEAFWVLELGISQAHDMDELGAMVRPDVVVINNIGPAHLEGLGSLEGVAKAKTDLLRYLSDGGAAFVCMDYPLLWDCAKEIKPDVIGFSAAGAETPYKGEYLGPLENGSGRFRLTLRDDVLEFEAPFMGTYFAENMIAAAAVAHSMGSDIAAIKAGILAASVPEHRFQICEAGPWTVIDDAYNANPLSMRRSMDNATELAGQRPLVLVLGEMKELGDGAADLHRELGLAAAKTGARALLWFGGHADAVRQGLGNGDWPGIFMQTDEPRNLKSNLAELDLDGGVVLVKGSRSCKMERYVRELAGNQGDCGK